MDVRDVHDRYANLDYEYLKKRFEKVQGMPSLRTNFA